MSPRLPNYYPTSWVFVGYIMGIYKLLKYSVIDPTNSSCDIIDNMLLFRQIIKWIAKLTNPWNYDINTCAWLHGASAD